MVTLINCVCYLKIIYKTGNNYIIFYLTAKAIVIVIIIVIVIVVIIIVIIIVIIHVGIKSTKEVIISRYSRSSSTCIQTHSDSLQCLAYSRSSVGTYSEPYYMCVCTVQCTCVYPRSSNSSVSPWRYNTVFVP